MKITTLKKNIEFSKVLSKGKWVIGRYIVLYYKKNNTDINKIGISLNKKVKNKVIKNRARRVIREVYRNNIDKLMKGYDIVFYCKEKEPNFGFKELNKDYLYIIRKSGLSVEKGDEDENIK